MTNTFNLLKNGKVANAVWANPTTKEIYPSNRNVGWAMIFTISTAKT